MVARVEKLGAPRRRQWARAVLWSLLAVTSAVHGCGTSAEGRLDAGGTNGFAGAGGAPGASAGGAAMPNPGSFGGLGGSPPLRPKPAASRAGRSHRQG